MINPISTINYNGSKDTIALIESLTESSEEFDLIIVDNCSSKSDEVDAIVKTVESNYGVIARFEEYTNERADGLYVLELSEKMIVTVIRGKDNFGFSIGTNIGLRYALDRYPEARYLTILNNDTEVTKNFLSKVILGIEKNNLVAAMGTILYYGYDEPYIWSIGGPVDYIKAQGVHVGKDTIFNKSDYKEACVGRNFISGCFTVFKREALEEINLLDEDYYFAGEEYQYSVDLASKYKIGWIPDSIIYHKSVKGIGNGSSHQIKDLKWQYNAYMVKIVFINKNKNIIYRKLWHCLLRLYIDIKLRKKYLAIPEYGDKYYKILREELFNNINKTQFLKEDFEYFSSILEKKR